MTVLTSPIKIFHPFHIYSFLLCRINVTFFSPQSTFTCNKLTLNWQIASKIWATEINISRNGSTKYHQMDFYTYKKLQQNTLQRQYIHKRFSKILLTLYRRLSNVYCVVRKMLPMPTAMEQNELQAMYILPQLLNGLPHFEIAAND